MSVGAIFASSGLSLPSARVARNAAQDAERSKGTSAPLQELFVGALREAVDSLQVSAAQRHKGIHSARKAMRRARSALQVASADLGPEAKACEHAIKGICRDLSSARDAQAQLDAFDRLVEKGRLTLAPDALARARRFLVRRRTRVVHGLIAKDPDFRTLRARLANALEAAQMLDWASVRREDTQMAFERSVRRALKAALRARASEREDVLHDWRRRMRRCVQQQAVLAGVGQAQVAGDRTSQDFADLVRLLGLENDLRVLHGTFGRASRLGAEERAVLSVTIDTEMRRLARRCAKRVLGSEADAKSDANHATS